MGSDLTLNINEWPKWLLEQIPKETLEQLRNLSTDTHEQLSNLTVAEGLSPFPDLHPERITKLFLSGTSEQLNINISEILKRSWNKYFGVLCLTQSYDNIPMWSHYSHNHEGFVLEFDPKNEFFQRERESGITEQLQEVRYSEFRRKIDFLEAINDERQLLNRIAEEVFFTKSEHWSNEQEIRMIKKLSNHNKMIGFEDQEIFLFNFNPEVVKSIYLGVNVTEQTEREIYEIRSSKSYRHLKCFKGILDLKEYKINFFEV